MWYTRNTKLLYIIMNNRKIITGVRFSDGRVGGPGLSGFSPDRLSQWRNQVGSIKKKEVPIFDIIETNNDLVIFIDNKCVINEKQDIKLSGFISENKELTLSMPSGIDLIFKNIDQQILKKITKATDFLLAATVQGQDDPAKLWVCNTKGYAA